MLVTVFFGFYALFRMRGFITPSTYFSERRHAGGVGTLVPAGKGTVQAQAQITRFCNSELQLIGDEEKYSAICTVHTQWYSTAHIGETEAHGDDQMPTRLCLRTPLQNSILQAVRLQLIGGSYLLTCL